MTGNKIAIDNLWRAILRDDPVYLPHQYEPTWTRLAYDGAYAEDWNDGSQHFTDHWGVGWAISPAQTLDISPYPVDHPLADLDALSTYRPPDPDDAGFSRIHAGLAEYPDRLNFGHLQIGPMERAVALMGMENFLVATVADPDRVKQVLEMVVDYTIAISRRMLTTDLVGAWITDDYGTQHSLLVSPRTWRQLIKPGMQAIFDVWKDAGRLVVLHSCGAVGPLVGDLVEMRLDVLHPLQATANDAVELKARWGDRLTFWGNVSSGILMGGTPDDVRREVRRAIRELGVGSGYVCGQDHTLPYPAVNMAALVETVTQYGRYPIDPASIPQ